MNKIEIGLKFYKKEKDSLDRYTWKGYRVVGIAYDTAYSSHYEWMEDKDISKLPQKVQIASLSDGLHQLNLFWKSLPELEKEISRDREKHPKYRVFRINKEGSWIKPY